MGIHIEIMEEVDTLPCMVAAKPFEEEVPSRFPEYPPKSIIPQKQEEMDLGFIMMVTLGTATWFLPIYYFITWIILR